MRKQVLAITIISVILVLTAFVGAQQELTGFNNGLQLLQYYSSALDRIIPALRPLDSALSQFKTCVKNQEAVDESLLFIALIYQEKGDLEAAKDNYLEYLRLYPTSEWVYALIGDIHYQLGEYEQAQDNYEKSLANAENAKAYYGLGEIYKRQDLAEETIDAFKTAVELAPEYIEARISLAKEYFRQQDYDLALEEFEMAYRFNVRSAELHYYLWQLYTINGDEEKAKHSRDLAIQYDPNYENLFETSQE